MSAKPEPGRDADKAAASDVRAENYQESKCPAYWLVPDMATACELHELNKQIARLIELTAKK